MTGRANDDAPRTQKRRAGSVLRFPPRSPPHDADGRNPPPRSVSRGRPSTQDRGQGSKPSDPDTPPRQNIPHKRTTPNDPAQARTPHTDTTNTRPTHNQDHNQPPPGQVSAQTVLGHPPPDLDRQDRTIAAHRFREAKNLTSGRQRWCIPAGGVSGLLGRSAGAMRKATVSALGISPTLALTAA